MSKLFRTGDCLVAVSSIKLLAASMDVLLNVGGQALPDLQALLAKPDLHHTVILTALKLLNAYSTNPNSG